ncbi:hypothetical protein Mgra_00007710, partial [Meloidogyne graminicola]
SSPYSSHWGSFFSTSFGPARDFGSIDDSKEWLEEQFKISIKEDVDVRKEYMKLISKGAYLSNYAGIWSIGLDLLPLVTENKVSFFIWKDKCCELEAWFLSPTVEKPNVESKEEKEKREARIHLHNKIPINRPIRISDGMLMSIRGYIKLKAKQVFIQLENRYPFYKKLEAIRWTANWANETNPEFRLESLIFGGKWMEMEPITIVNENMGPWSFSRGSNFLMEIQFWSTYITFTLNCIWTMDFTFGRNVYFAFEDIYLLTIEGSNDIELVENIQLLPPDFGTNEQNWKIELRTGDGIMVRGNVKKNVLNLNNFMG